MTNPKPTQKLKCAICGRETFYPGKWRWMDPDAEKKSIVHTECWKNVSNFVLPLEDQVEILLQENANLKYQVAQLPPVYTKCADDKPTEYGRYLTQSRNGIIDIASYSPNVHEWHDRYGYALDDIVSWCEIPK